MAGPLSMSNMSDTDPQMLQMGHEALVSGKVTPEEVQQAAGMMHQNPDWLNNIMSQGKEKKSPYVFAPPQMDAMLPTTSKAQGKGKQTKSEVKSTTDSKTSSTRNTMASPDEFLSMTDSVRNLPEIQEQQKGLDDSQALLNMQQAQDGKNSDYWVRPLTALADATNKTHLMEGMPVREDQGQKNQQMLKAQDELAKRKAELSKTILDGVSKLKTGSETNAQNQTLMQQLQYTMGQMNGGAGGLANVRQQKFLSDIGASFDKDKKGLGYESTFDNLDRAHEMLYGDVPITPALFNTLQEDMTRAISGGGNQMADAKLKREATKTMQEAMAKIANYAGKITDLRTQMPDVFNQLQGIESKMRGEYKKSYNQRLNQLTQNYKYNEPEYYKAAQEKADMIRQMRGIDPAMSHSEEDRAAAEAKYKGGGKAPPPGQAVSAAPVKKSDADILKMSDAEYDAYKKAHYGG